MQKRQIIQSKLTKINRAPLLQCTFLQDKNKEFSSRKQNNNIERKRTLTHTKLDKMSRKLQKRKTQIKATCILLLMRYPFTFINAILEFVLQTEIQLLIEFPFCDVANCILGL